MIEQANGDQMAVSAYDAKRIRVHLRRAWRWSWDNLKRLAIIFIQRGYIAIALGVLLVKGTLEVVWGTIPQMPGKLAESALIITVIISMFMYRQTVSLLRLRMLRMRDRRTGARLSPTALRAGPSEEVLEATESHWRSRKAMLWIVLSALTLSAYLFTYQVTVREANISDPITAEQVQVAVVVPPEFMRPQPIRDSIQSWADKGMEGEALDHSLSYNGGLYAYTIPNEYPMHIYSIVIPLNALFIVFCVMLTRSLAFAFAPANSAAGKPASPASSTVETKPNTVVAHKGEPSGSDMGVEILDTLDDLQNLI